MSNYTKRVQDNLTYMKTDKSEWRAIQIVGMADVEGKSMPQFAFPVGYEKAKSMYSSNGVDVCCELCGHAIKNCFWLQNDEKKIVLMVGSECVTHFEQTSGEKLTKEYIYQRNLAVYIRAIDTIKMLWAKFTMQEYMGYGKYRQVLKFGDWQTNNKIMPLYDELHDIVKFGGGMYVDPATISKASLTKMYTKHAARIEALCNFFEDLYAFHYEHTGIYPQVP